MSRIRSRDTKPEQMLRSALWSEGIRYRLHKKVEGIRPDLVFAGARVAVFIDGCQWHGCPKHYVAPRTRTDFWQQKLLLNINRDEKQTVLLEQAGWAVLRIWEHEVWEDTPKVVSLVRSVLKGTPLEQTGRWRVFKVETVNPDINLERRYLRLLGQPESEQVVEVIRSTSKWSRTSPLQTSTKKRRKQAEKHDR